MTTSANTARTPARSGAEQDVISRRNRHAHTWTQRAGVTAGIKRDIRRRDAKLSIRTGAW